MAYRTGHMSAAPPPAPETAAGQPRHVGIEIEFADIPVNDAARLVHDLFGGTVVPEGEHRATVGDTEFGAFTVELDAQIVHSSNDDADTVGGKVDAQARAALGHAVAGVVPVEIVAPPIPWSDLQRLTPLFDALRERGAKGTDASPLYGFGLHLNPEAAELNADYALRHLQAFILLAAWLREAIGIDPTRRLLPHIDPFPGAYAQQILATDYAPDLDGLIRDYVQANPTRNRGLDMMPLFRHLDEDLFLDALGDPDMASLVKARPTFHYRLPNAGLSDPNWNAVVEWNRWVEVEKLAADRALLRQRADQYMDFLSMPLAERWLATVHDWFAS